MAVQVELLLDAHAQIGEGPLWDEEQQVLYWVNIMENLLHIYDPATGEDQAMDVGQPVGTVVVRGSGGLMLALQHGFASFDLHTHQVKILADPEAHLPENRFNDGKCDPAGRFWAGTMAIAATKGAGSLYCLDTDLSVRRMLGDISISNGIVWSLDHGTMYYIDSLKADVRAYDFEVQTGNIANERVVCRFTEGMGLPDGMAIDAEGMLWVAQYNGSRVCRWNPHTGQVLETIMLPVSRVTACAFGGADLDTLYITSASQGMSPDDWKKEPHAGGLFACKPGVRGVPTFRFKG
ncbi:MAG: SMP-30/gluconolactonase/LRE family protein [Candidatus Latescibacteria bacterium]|nr:SMP-30/gluconolactonase/LRE family protein [Candidatus Latescibacterota bacterium]